LNSLPEELSGVAITATINAEGHLRPVGAFFGKLQEAASAALFPRIHTFVVSDQQPEIKELPLSDPHGGLVIVPADKLDEALKKVREDMHRRQFDASCILDHHAELQRHTDFVGRDWLFDAMEAFIQSETHGYLLLSGVLVSLGLAVPALPTDTGAAPG